MKRVIKYFSFGLVSVLALSACSDQFLQDKKNYDNVTADMYNYIEGANARMNDLYAWCLPQVADLAEGTNYLSVSIGANDIAGGSTEEYTGFSNFVNPDIELTSMSSSNAVPDYFIGTHNNTQNAVYGRIRNINDFINGVSG
ncbi:MAG: RagB/SusD family nutrient uptake outer membrane protein, partial [Prevotella sp.]|nr:RagB/SusD family nutrient uptake outer membrane protein [Prevotella sp.]